MGFETKAAKHAELHEMAMDGDVMRMRAIDALPLPAGVTVSLKPGAHHLMLMDLRGTGVTGKEMQLRLDEVNITSNKNTIPFDPEKPFVTSGVRLGTAAVTSRGMDEADMEEIADLISLTLTDFDAKKEEIIRRVDALTSRYPLYPEI